MARTNLATAQAPAAPPRNLPLTDERRRMIAAALPHWLQVGLCTEPADFDAAETAIASMYARAGRPRPYFVRLASPAAAELYLNLLVTAWPALAKGADQLRGQLRDQLSDQLRGQLSDQLRGQLSGQLIGQLSDQLRGQLSGQLIGQLSDQLRGQLSGQLIGQLSGQLIGQLSDQLRGQLSDQLRGQLRDQLSGQLRGQLSGQLRGQLSGQLIGQLRGQLSGQLIGQLRGQLSGQLSDQLSDQKLRYFGAWFWGQWDSSWAAYYSHARDLGAVYSAEINTWLDEHVTVCRSIGWWYQFDDCVIMTDRPSVIARDDRMRLHCEDGPALSYRDGYALYAVHGTRVPGSIITAPETITVSAIDAERNAEVRRVMTARYGLGADRDDGKTGAAAYLKDAGAELLDEDLRLTRLSGWAKGSAAQGIIKAMPWAADYVARDDSYGPGRLYRRNVPDDEPIVMVELVNASPELDGSLKTYMLRVPPTVRTCREAVAWTFGMTVDQWQPAMET